MKDGSGTMRLHCEEYEKKDLLSTDHKEFFLLPSITLGSKIYKFYLFTFPSRVRVGTSGHVETCLLTHSMSLRLGLPFALFRK